MTPTAFLFNPSLFLVVGLLLYFQYIVPRYTIYVDLNGGYVVVADVSIDCFVFRGLIVSVVFFFYLETTFFYKQKILYNLMDNLQGFEKHSWKCQYHLHKDIFEFVYKSKTNIIHGNSFGLTWQHLLKMVKCECYLQITCDSFFTYVSPFMRLPGNANDQLFQ